MNWEYTKFDVRSQLNGKECMFVGCVSVEFTHPSKGMLEIEVGVYAVFREGARIGQGLAWKDMDSGKAVVFEGIRMPNGTLERPAQAVARFYGGAQY